jgi:hypothetical protein
MGALVLSSIAGSTFGLVRLDDSELLPKAQAHSRPIPRL